MSTGRPQALLVTPRPPKADGRGDQRRAHGILVALAPDWDVEVVSWLPEESTVGPPRRWQDFRTLARAVTLARDRPLQVAYFHADVPEAVKRRVAKGAHDCVIFVTDRAVLPANGTPTVIDFVDDIGGTALRRAGTSRGPAAVFWRWEGERLRRFDRRLAEQASLAVAHSSADAAGISDRVKVVPLSITTRPLPPGGDRVVFIGNLFYGPNHDAAVWICDQLVPALARLGIQPGRIVIAGRRPRPALVGAARRVGVDFRADFADQAEILAEAAVALSPMALGSGNQCKIVDAVGAARPCVLTPLANAGLDLVDEHSALVRERAPEPFARAVARLLGDTALRQTLAANAAAQLAHYTPEAVQAQWRAALSSTVVAASD